VLVAGFKGRISEGSRVPWNYISSAEGAWNSLTQRVPGILLNLGTLWAPGEKGKMPDIN